MIHDYPYQTVIVNTHPSMGTTLSNMVNQEQDEKEGREATKKFSSTPQSHCSGKPPVKVIMLHLHCVLVYGLLLDAYPVKGTVTFYNSVKRFRLLQSYFGHLS